MNLGEQKTLTFFLTVIAVGCLTEAITRYISLMRLTPSVVICMGVGLVALVIDIIDLGLSN